MPTSLKVQLLLPLGREDRGLQRDVVADLPPELLRKRLADDAPVRVRVERLELLGRQRVLRIQVDEAGPDGEDGKEVLRILVDAAEPVRVGDIPTPGIASICVSRLYGSDCVIDSFEVVIRRS